MNMSERVAAALAASGRSPRDLAKDIGVSVARISQLKSGSGGIKAENLFALARATGHSAQWLAEGAGPSRLTSEQLDRTTVIRPFHVPSASNQSVYPIAFDLRWLENLQLQIASLKYIQISDVTMEPTASDGDILLIDESQTNPEPGKIFLILRPDGSPVIRRFLQSMSEGWIIRSDNDNNRHYPDERFSDDGLQRLNIAGKVVWRGGKV